MNRNGTILLAEDDENDAFLFRMALKKAGIPNPLSHVPDGEDAVHEALRSAIAIVSDWVETADEAAHLMTRLSESLFEES